MLSATRDDPHHLGEAAKRLRRLVSRLAKFSVLDICQSAAGLLTQIENHPANGRIELLIHLAVMSSRGSRVPNNSQLREWLNDIIYHDNITALEDPVEDVFVSNVTMWLGNARLLEGRWTDNDYYTQSSLGALNLIRSRPWAETAQMCVTSLLLLSEAIAKRSLLTRFSLSNAINRRPIAVAAATVDLARSRVEFSWDEIAEMGIDRQFLRPFVFTHADTVKLYDECIGHTTLERKPLLPNGRGPVVALPNAIGASVRRFLIDAASEVGELDQLQAAIDTVQFQDIWQHGCSGWGLKTISKLEVAGIDRAIEVVGTFDNNSYAQVVFIPDDLASISIDSLVGLHTMPKSFESWIDKRVRTLSSQGEYRRGLTIVVHGGVGRGFVADLGRPPEGWRTVGLSIPDFMRFAWDTGFTAICAWKLLTQESSLKDRGIRIVNINGFPNLYSYARQNDFVLAPVDFNGDAMFLATSFVADFRHQLRIKLDRHAALGPERNEWIEIQRSSTEVFFKEAEFYPDYISTERTSSKELLGCTETNIRTWWIQSVELPDNDRNRVIVFKLWEVCRYWLTPLAPKLERRFPTLASGPVTIHVIFSKMDAFENGILEFIGPPSPPHVHCLGHDVIINCSLSYLSAFSQSTNLGEQLLAAAIIKGVSFMVDEVLETKEIYTFVRDVVTSDSARFFHIIPTNSLEQQLLSAISPPAPRFQAPEDRAWSCRGLARQSGWTGIQAQDAVNEGKQLLDKATDILWSRIRYQLNGLDRGSVVQRALLNYQAVQHDRSVWRVSAAAFLALYGDTSNILRAAHEREGQRSLAGLASRVIAEMALCASPLRGGAACSDIDLDLLIADVATMLECAGESDALHFGLITNAPEVSANGSFIFDLSFTDTLQAPYVEAYNARAFRSAVAGYGDHFETPIEGGGPDPLFDYAFSSEFGLGLFTCVKFVADCAKEALKLEALQFQLRKDEVLARLREAGALDPEKAYRAIARRRS